MASNATVVRPEDKSVAQPPAKKAKVDEPAKVEEAEVKAEATAVEPKEKEVDAKDDARAGLKHNIDFETCDTTLNVVVGNGGRVLACLADGGMQYLIAGARANTGFKAGRYMYEVKVIEAVLPSEADSRGHHAYGKGGPSPRQVVRAGFSAAGSSLLLGDGDGGVYFDAEGGYFAEGKRTPNAGKRFGREAVAAVLVNLDAKSPNSNTISLFVNGERASKPQPFPETFKGQPLFPHISFRNVTLQVHFGLEPMRPLPFKCRMAQGAAAADAKQTKPPVPVDGKHEVLFPVTLPDEGSFNWLDDFLEQNPQYVELSDRKIIEWASKSGLLRNKTWSSCNDKPEFNFGLPSFDDFSARRVINAVAPLAPRNYVVMEVKQNLVASDRSGLLNKFPARKFKKVATVMLGEPNKAYKQLVKNKLLKAKQAKLDAEFKQKQAAKEKKRLAAKMQKEFEERRKKVAAAKAEAKKKAEEAKRKAEAAKKSEADGDEDKKDDDDDGDEDEKEEENEEEKEDEDKKDEEEEEDEDAEPEAAELTPEEEQMWHVKGLVGDLTQQVFDRSFAQFSIPDKAEGFDEIRYEWQKETASKDYLHKFVLERKRSAKIDTLQPSDWFKQQQADWTTKFREWQAKQTSAKSVVKRKKTDDDEEEPAVDIYSVENICDVGGGEPLFFDFSPEDWALCTLRWELHLLAAAFKKDVDDPDRPAIPEAHVTYYYSKYFRKNLTWKAFAKDNLASLVTMVKDSVSLEGEPLMLSTKLAEDATPETVVKLTEESRRERQRRIDAGDETARLKFSAQQLQQQPQAVVVVGKAGGNKNAKQQWTPRKS
mmetsp:Transcript_121531/g.343824  ORF Transcript_121531/g.343824 Transcript_121531/m.343824 type:complete len:822 (-) Transcript_121531:120-2585(-)